MHAVIGANYQRVPVYFNCSKCIGGGNQCHSLEAYDLLARVENEARTVKPYMQFRGRLCNTWARQLLRFIQAGDEGIWRN